MGQQLQFGCPGVFIGTSSWKYRVGWARFMTAPIMNIGANSPDRFNRECLREYAEVSKPSALMRVLHVSKSAILERMVNQTPDDFCLAEVRTLSRSRNTQSWIDSAAGRKANEKFLNAPVREGVS